MVATFINRSGRQRLRLELDNKCRWDDKCSPELVQSVVGACDRWQKITFNLDKNDILAVLAGTTANGGTPLLESMNIYPNRRFGNKLDDRTLYDLPGPLAPSVQTINISAQVVLNTSIQSNSVRFLGGDMSPPFSALLQALRNFPLIEAISFMVDPPNDDWSWDTPEDDTIWNITLPNLQTVTILLHGKFDMEFSFFDHLTLPSLQSLDFSFPENSNRETWIHISPLIERSRCQLEKLFLWGVSKEELYRCLQLAPRLSELSGGPELCDLFDDGSLTFGATRSGLSDPLIPSLRYIQFMGEWDFREEAMADFIVSRSRCELEGDIYGSRNLLVVTLECGERLDSLLKHPRLENRLKEGFTIGW